MTMLRTQAQAGKLSYGSRRMKTVRERWGHHLQG
jgi:hypothetical protein